MLRRAGVGRVLLDQFDYPRLASELRSIEKILDCGAYRVWKSRESKKALTVTLDDYLEFAEGAGPSFKHVASLDVIGDPAQSRENWLSALRRGLAKRLRMFPVWQFGSAAALLEEYLRESEVVGIGGLVPLMRAKDEAMLRELKKLPHGRATALSPFRSVMAARHQPAQGPHLFRRFFALAGGGAQGTFDLH